MPSRHGTPTRPSTMRCAWSRIFSAVTLRPAAPGNLVQVAEHRDRRRPAPRALPADPDDSPVFERNFGAVLGAARLPQEISLGHGLQAHGRLDPYGAVGRRCAPPG